MSLSVPQSTVRIGTWLESQAFRNLAEKLVSARIAIKVDWKTKAGVKTDKYFINGRVNQSMAKKSFEVVII